MSRVLVVFGASGNQGSSVVTAIQNDATLSEGYQIRALGRDTSKHSMVKYANQGIETVVADMNSPASIAQAVKGAHTVFLMTNFWEAMSADVEFAQAKNVVDASRENGVQHLVFSSLINVSEASGGRLSHVSHFDGKAKVEEYIRKTGVPATFVLPGMFMSQYIDMIRDNGDGSFTLALPISEDEAQIPLIDAAGDIGAFVVEAIRQPGPPSGKRIYASEAIYTPRRIVSEFAEVIGWPTNFMQLPSDVFKSFLPEAIAQELLENMLLMESPGYYAGAMLADGIRPAQSSLTTWRSFVKKNKSTWLKDSK